MPKAVLIRDYEHDVCDNGVTSYECSYVAYDSPRLLWITLDHRAAGAYVRHGSVGTNTWKVLKGIGWVKVPEWEEV